MIVIFKEMLRDAIEFYADDVVVKSWKRIGHLEHLRVVFDKLCQHQLEMNLLKCAFRATSRKFLWFVVHHWGIKVDFTKIKTIIKLPPPKNIQELRGFQGRIVYIQRFI